MSKTDFSDLEDSAEWGDAPPAAAPVDTDAQRVTREVSGGAINNAHAATDEGQFVENCPKCVGGTFMSYTGRAVGPCYHCKGTGKLTFKTSPETRKHNRERATRRKLAKQDAQCAGVVAWLAANPERAEFLNQDWEFPRSLKAGLHKYGSLTERQIAAIDRSLAKQAEKAEARKADGTDIDLSAVPSGHYAVPDGDTRLKVHIGHPRKGSRWEDWVFVDDGAEYGQRQKYGAQRPGEMYAGKIQDALRAIVADPFAASVAYGKLVGACGVCGRKLETESSVAAGIGPVCAAKLGG